LCAVALVLVGGQPGTGKTTLADAVADKLGWAVLSSDRIRKELAGIPPEADGRAAFGTGIYTPSWTARTYAELLRRAGELLARGESVILDASWSSAELRSAAADLARYQHARLVELRCVASAGLACRRMAARPRGPSDAGPEVARLLAAAAAPWPTATVIDTEAGGVAATAELGDAAATAESRGTATAAEPDCLGPGFAHIVGQALAAIRPHGAEHV
jgi:predicted kinase